MPTYGPNIIPLMTGNTAPAGYVASASTESYYPAYQAFNRNNDSADYWYGFPEYGTGTLRIQLPDAKTVAKIRLLGAGPVNTGYYPKEWSFDGSNDGVTWTQLHYEANTAAHDDGAFHDYEFVNTTEYTRYRISIFSVTGVSAGNVPRAPALVSMEMYEAGVVDPAPLGVLKTPPGLGLGLGLGL